MDDKDYFEMKFTNLESQNNESHKTIVGSLEKLNSKITRLFERQDKHHDALIIHEEKFKNIKEAKERAWKVILSVSSSLIVVIILGVFSYFKFKGG